MTILLGLRLARRDTRPAAYGLAGALTMAATLLLPVYLGYLDVWLRNPDLDLQTAWPADVAARIPLRVPLWPLAQGPAAVPDAALLVILVGAVTVFVTGRSAIGPGDRRAWRHGLLWATRSSTEPAAVA
jgi:hypothetical protein